MSPQRGKVSYRPSAGLVLGFISLFVALTSVAAGNLPGKSSVNSGDIAAKNVKTSDIAIGAVTSGRIADGSVKTSKLAAAAVDNSKLAANSVNTGQLVDSAVTNPKLAADAVDSGKIADNSVTTGDVANGSLTGADVAPNSLTGADINESTLGPVLDVVYARNSGNCTVAEGTQASCTATCPAGRNALGGGVVAEGNFAEQVEINGSRPNPNAAAATGWTGFVDNSADLGGANNNNNVTVYAICTPIASGSFLAVAG